MLEMRVRAYAPGGAALGLLPSPQQIEASFPHNDAGALSLTYSSLAAGGPLVERGLEQGIELAVEISAGGAWTEPPGGRFVVIGRERDRADESRTVTLSGPSIAWLLTKFRNLATANLLPPEHTQAGKRPFYTAGPGTIVATLMQEATTRAGLPLTRSFTTATDSAGAAWAQVLTIYYDLGLDLWAVLDNLTQQGVCDWRTQARALALWNPDTACARDLSATVRLHLGRDLSDAPESETLEDVVASVLIRGEDGLLITETNPSAPTPWGTWEGFISQSGVSDEGTARTLVQADLARGARTRGQYTRQLVITDRSRHLPMVDYLPGDWITAPTTGTPESVRLQQITLTRDEKGVVAGNVVLNDRLIDAELRRAKRMKGIVGGTSAESGTGRPVPDGPDRRTPAAPLGLVVGSTSYLDPDGAARGRIEASWGAVTTATDGTALEVSSYELWGRRNIAGAPWVLITTSTTTDATGFGYDVGSSWQFRVRAIGTYALYPSAASNTVTVTIVTDTTPPPVPSAPTLSTRLGTVTVRWDGKTSIGTGMPADFSHVDVRVGLDTVGALRGSSDADLLVLSDLAYATSVDVRLRAVDRTGNVSAWSTVASIVPVRATGPDLEANSVTTNTIAAGAITTVKLDASAVTADKLDAGAVTTVKLDAGAVTTVKLDAGAVTTVKLDAGAVTAEKVAAGAITTVKLDASAVTADKIAAGAVTAERVALGVTSMNLVPNPGFEDTGIQPPPVGNTNPSMASWSVDHRGTGRTDAWRYSGGGNCRSGWGYAVLWSGSDAGNGTLIQSGWITVTPGRQYRIGAWIRNLHAACGLYLGVYKAASIGGPTTWEQLVATAPAPSATWANPEATWTCPAGVGAIRLGLFNQNAMPYSTGRGIVVDDSYCIPVGSAVTEVTPGGLRMWDSAGNVTVDLNGDSGTITGKTLVSGSLTGPGIAVRMDAGGLDFFAAGNLVGSLLAYHDGLGNRSIVLPGANTRLPDPYKLDVRGGANIGMNSTTSSANVYSSGNLAALLRSSSLRALKHFREEIPAHYAVLDLPPMTWLEQHPEEPGPRAGRIAGFVAEDVAVVSAFHGGVLDPLLVIDENGDLQGLAYDRIAAYLIPVIRDMHARLTAVEQMGA